jgi:hypothetical protein
MNIIKGKSYICTECGKVPGQGCVTYIVGIPMVPILCLCDATLTAKFVDQTELIKKKLKL